MMHKENRDIYVGFKDSMGGLGYIFFMREGECWFDYFQLIWFLYAIFHQLLNIYVYCLGVHTSVFVYQGIYEH